MSTRGCISSVSYIKPQQHHSSRIIPRRCISSVSYIKPQPQVQRISDALVVYRPFPTSNHNSSSLSLCLQGVVYRPFPTSNHNSSSLSLRLHGLYIVRFLHQTTTSPSRISTYLSCISSVSYIKPQPAKKHFLLCPVVYRPFPTSNHN